MDQETKTEYTYIGNLKVKVTSEMYNKKPGDTKIEVKEPGNICWVSGACKDEFIEKLKKLIETYQI